MATNKVQPHKMMTRNTNEEKNALTLTSPIVRKLQKVKSTDSADRATYRGIISKCIFFMALILVGAACFTLVLGNDLSILMQGEEVDLSTIQTAFIFGSIILFVASPFLALVRRLTPVFGSLSFFCTGSLIAFLACVVKDYREIILLAALLTFLLVFVMQIIYSTGIIRVNQKFKTGLTALFTTMILASLLIFVLTLIPATRPFVLFFQQFSLLTIGGAVLGLVIAVCFLLVDFNNVQETVENGLPKEYEWTAAFGLSYTVVWIYFKILDILAMLQKNN